MTGPLDVSPPQLREMAARLDEHRGEVDAIRAPESLAGVAASVQGSRVAAITGALAERLSRAASELGSGLTITAGLTRSVTDTIVGSDYDNAVKLGGR